MGRVKGRGTQVADVCKRQIRVFFKTSGWIFVPQNPEFFPFWVLLQNCTFSNTNVYGCTNPIADNYEEAATIDNGSCTFSARYGCTDENANNYNENATDDDGTCQYDVKYGCTDVAADNFDSYATNDDGSCQYTLSGGATGGTGGTGLASGGTAGDGGPRGRE